MTNMNIINYYYELLLLIIIINHQSIISATLCGWKCCFVADQLWFMTRTREEDYY